MGLYWDNGKENGIYYLGFRVLGFTYRWTPHPVIVTIRDNKVYIRGPIIFLVYHYYRVGGPPNVWVSRFLSSSEA